MTFLMPDMTGQKLTVDAVLAQPMRITKRLADLIAPRSIAGVFFSSASQAVTGGGILYSTLSAADLYSSEVENRAPGDEYRTVNTPDPKYDVAKVQDRGGKFDVFDEEIQRNQADVVDQRTRQLANTLLRSLDRDAIAAVEQALDTIPNNGGTIPGVDFGAIELHGDPATHTPTSGRVEAVLASVNLAAEVDELGLTFDTLVLHPNERAALELAYGKDLQAILDAFGYRIVSSNRVTPGEGYAVVSGQVGRIAFETPLKTEVIDKRENRKKVVQSYVVPAFAPDMPQAVKKLTGLAGA